MQQSLSPLTSLVIYLIIYYIYVMMLSHRLSSLFLGSTSTISK